MLSNVMLQFDIRRMDRAMFQSIAMNLFKAEELEGGPAACDSVFRSAELLVHDPVMLITVEPFGALDALMRGQFGVDIQRLGMERRMTTLHITHNIPEAVLSSIAWW
jgi:ABC-type nitrate/sulfonate/bicarbonate transport system ATPase subunit